MLVKNVSYIYNIYMGTYAHIQITYCRVTGRCSDLATSPFRPSPSNGL